MAHAERIAGFVLQAAAVQRQLDMAHVLVGSAVLAEARPLEVAAADALVEQQFGREGVFVRPRAGMTRTQRGDGRQGGRGRRRCFQQVACVGQGLFAPWRGNGVDVQVGQTHGEQPAAAEFGQACIQPRRDAAEVGIAGIAQAEHGVLQFRQLRRALATQEFDQADAVVRRIAFALGADDDVEQALAAQFALRVGVGA